MKATHWKPDRLRSQAAGSLLVMVGKQAPHALSPVTSKRVSEPGAKVPLYVQSLGLDGYEGSSKLMFPPLQHASFGAHVHDC
jgi:hypothetical protein